MIPVSITFDVRDEQELQAVHQTLALISKYRNAQVEAADEATPERPVHPDDVEGKVVGTITPEGVTKPTPEKPAPAGEAEMAQVVQVALDKLGLAKVREIIGKHSGGKRWRESDPAVWPAMRVDLEQALAAVK